MGFHGRMRIWLSALSPMTNGGAWSSAASSPVMSAVTASRGISPPCLSRFSFSGQRPARLTCTCTAVRRGRLAVTIQFDLGPARATGAPLGR